MLIKDAKSLTRKILNRDRVGSTSFEWAMLSPFTFLVVFVAIFIMLLLFSWASYGSLASNLASDLNFRQTGLARADAAIPNMNAISLKRSAEYASLSGSAISDLTVDQVHVNVGNSTTADNAKYKKAVLYHMVYGNGDRAGYASQIYFPYCTYYPTDGITVNVTRANGDISMKTEVAGEDGVTDPHTSKNFSSSVVKVIIQYHFMPVQFMNSEDGFGVRWDGIGMTAVGYGIIT